MYTHVSKTSQIQSLQSVFNDIVSGCVCQRHPVALIMKYNKAERYIGR